jgi:hypothetical protein
MALTDARIRASRECPQTGGTALGHYVPRNGPHPECDEVSCQLQFFTSHQLLLLEMTYTP